MTQFGLGIKAASWLQQHQSVIVSTSINSSTAMNSLILIVLAVASQLFLVSGSNPAPYKAVSKNYGYYDHGYGPGGYYARGYYGKHHGAHPAYGYGYGVPYGGYGYGGYGPGPAYGRSYGTHGYYGTYGTPYGTRYGYARRNYGYGPKGVFDHATYANGAAYAPYKTA